MTDTQVGLFLGISTGVLLLRWWAAPAWRLPLFVLGVGALFVWRVYFDR